MMSSGIQVEAFIFSFIYGYLFYYLTRFNRYIILGKNTFVKLIISIIFVIDIVILYIYTMYKINNGIIHVYFVTSVILGYLVGNSTYDKLKCFCKICVKKIKKLK